MGVAKREESRYYKTLSWEERTWPPNDGPDGIIGAKREPEGKRLVGTFCSSLGSDD